MFSINPFVDKYGVTLYPGCQIEYDGYSGVVTTMAYCKGPRPMITIKVGSPVRELILYEGAKLQRLFED